MKWNLVAEIKDLSETTNPHNRDGRIKLFQRTIKLVCKQANVEEIICTESFIDVHHTQEIKRKHERRAYARKQVFNFDEEWS